MSIESIGKAIASIVPEAHRKQFARSFVGTLLGQAIALLGMLLAYVTAVGFLYKLFGKELAEFRDLLGNLIFWPVLLAPVAFIFVFSFMPTVLRGWRERQLLRRSIAKEAGMPGLFRLHPYGAKDYDRYVRPDGADDQAVAWLENAEKTILYLFGASGAGKSSLLGASVLPKLTELGWECISLRLDDDPADRLRTTLLDANERFDGASSQSLSLKTLFELAGQVRTAARANPLLIVVDQFEEFLILNDAAARAPLVELLQSLHHKPVPGVRLLCVFRSDYRELLFKLGLPGYTLGVNAFELAPFLRGDAEKFLRVGGNVLSAEGYDALFNGLDRIEEARGCYRPITLNMVGLVLDRMAGRIEGDPEKLIERYLRDCLTEGHSSDFAKSILRHMITEVGTKEPRDVLDLVEETGFEPWQVECTLADLEGDGLVRVQSQDRRRWEISHDFLARQIGILLGRMRPSWLRRAAPIALPAAVIGWAALLFLGLDYWPSLQQSAALADLRRIGFVLKETDGREWLTLDRTSFSKSNWRAFRSTFHKLPKPIQSLDLSSVGKFPDLLPLKGLPLKRLKLRAPGNTGLELLKGVQLEELALWGANRITSLEPLKALPLKRLTITDAGRITSLEPLKSLPLKRFTLFGADRVTSLEPLKSLPLKRLYLHGAKRITSLDPLKGVQLDELTLSGPGELTSIEPLKSMPLRKLSIRYFNQITNLEPLKGMKLEELDLWLSDGVTNLALLKGMPLKKLDLRIAKRIINLEPLRGMQLEQLGLKGADGITNLEPLKGMPLRKLDLSNTKEITNLSGLKEMRLEELDLSGTSGITSLEPLKGMPLRKLDLSNTKGITNLVGLEDMPLEELDLSFNDEITNLVPLKGLPLRKLNLSANDQITSLNGLEGMPLEELDISSASGVKNLEPVSGIIGLRIITSRLD